MSKRRRPSRSWNDLGIGAGSLALARDGRTLLAVRIDDQADIWLLGAPDQAPRAPSGREGIPFAIAGLGASHLSGFSVPTILTAETGPVSRDDSFS